MEELKTPSITSLEKIKLEKVEIPKPTKKHRRKKLKKRRIKVEAVKPSPSYLAIANAETQELLLEPSAPEGSQKAVKEKYDLGLEINRSYSREDLKTSYTLSEANRMPQFNQNRMLRQMLNLPSLSSIDEIREGFKSGYQLLLEKAQNTVVYSTGIEELDSMFVHKGIASGDILEFCGHCHTGKSLMIMTLLINILSAHESTEVVYYDTKNDFRTEKLHEFMAARGLSDEKMRNITSRIEVIKMSKIEDFLSDVQRFIDWQQESDDGEKQKVGFIVIDSITVPFFHASSNCDYNKMLMSVVQSTFRLLSNKGFTIITSNLGLHTYKISESDKGEKDTDDEDDDDENADGASLKTEDSRIINESLLLSEVKPALESINWKEALDYRFIISAPQNPKIDILGFIEAPRVVTVVESPTECKVTSFKIIMTDTGVVCYK